VLKILRLDWLNAFITRKQKCRRMKECQKHKIYLKQTLNFTFANSISQKMKGWMSRRRMRGRKPFEGARFPFAFVVLRSQKCESLILKSVRTRRKSFVGNQNRAVRRNLMGLADVGNSGWPN
jgi:hypothetical protein